MRNPYVDESGNLKIETEENRKRHELQQKQRVMERAIRKTKHELIMKQQEIDLVAETDVKSILQGDYDRLAAKWQEQNKRYNEFCQANDLQPQYDRIKVADFGRKQSAKANGAAKRYANSKLEIVAKTDSSDTIKLSDNEQYAVNRYISSESYAINGKLRRGEQLSERDKAFIKDLDSALDKMPEHKGTVYRSVSSFGIDDADGFIQGYMPGTIKSFPSYISTSESVYDDSFPIQYVIQSKHGKDIRVYNASEREILFKRDSYFLVTEIRDNIIYMEEI